MNSAKEVDQIIEQMKADKVPLSEAIFQTGVACVGWPYTFGARGGLTTKNGIQVRQFDCRGFTYWCALQYGIKIMGAGCTSQWNDDSNWQAKGLISDGMPEDSLVCLFYKEKDDPKKMAHTGFGYQGATVECSSGVQYFAKRKAKWTHWAIPKGVDAELPDYRPTLRKGDKGAYVTLAQTELLQKGYDLGKWGVDGDFGAATESAVKSFQRDNGLVIDGIIGQKTWDALESHETILYTVTVPHMTKFQAEGLVKQYAGAYMTAERG